MCASHLRMPFFFSLFSVVVALCETSYHMDIHFLTAQMLIPSTFLGTNLSLSELTLLHGIVIVAHSLITVPIALLCQSIAPEAVSLFSIA